VWRDEFALEYVEFTSSILLTFYPPLFPFLLDPDIACYAKLLTGGLIPLSVTLASEEVFNTYMGDEKGQALLHGHSYTAHPIGCVSALHALESYNATLERDHDPKTGPRMSFDVGQAQALSLLPLVEQSFTLGTVLAVTIKPEDGTSGYGATSQTVPIVQSLRQVGVFARPLGNVIYIMVSPLTSREECTRLTDILYKTIKKMGDGQSKSSSSSNIV
jgi:dethiobiotin synthetase/adenosylmethionine--8-amino-7-oxononanoate aminotransferase